MEQTKVQKLAKTLNLLVTITFAVPQPLQEAYRFRPGQHLTLKASFDGEELRRCYSICRSYLPGEISVAVKAIEGLFLLACGLCSAGILRQAHWILNTIQEGNPFQMRNAQAMKRAALFCWGISAAALLRFVWEVWDLRHIAPLFTYNALAVPVFFMGGLLFLVMSALFRQAAELQEDQDLTI